MVVTCRCKTILTAEPDGILDDQRQIRLYQRMGMVIAEHIQKHHTEELQKIGLIAAQFSGWLVLATVNGDAEFATWRESTRAELAKIFEPPGVEPPQKVGLA